MGIDGIFLYELKSELCDALRDTRIDKIHQPSKEELVLLLRKAGGNMKLLINARPSCPRVHITESTFENPAEPPMFCMLIRKYLSGARFRGIENNGFERTVTLIFDAVNEMGDEVVFKLTAELIGKQTNIILVDKDGKIVDAVRRSDLETSQRIIQSGARYSAPERAVKLAPTENGAEALADAVISLNMPLFKAIITAVDGVSPLISREIAVRSGLDTDMPSALDGEQRRKLEKGFEWFISAINHPVPTAVYDENGVPFEFSFTEIKQYGSSVTQKRFESFSVLLDSVFSERDRKERIKALGNDLQRLVVNLHTRTLKKIAVREKELEQSKNCEILRVYGELLKANLYAVERGMPYVDVVNYYDPGLGTVRIPLNVALSPAQNAQKYFKDYKKCCNASLLLGGLIKESKDELQYIESVADELLRAQSVADLREIKNELADEGYIRRTASEKKEKQKPFCPEKVLSPDGFTVLVGRNNRQNDELTLKIADKSDMWFHTKNIPGSHVIVKTEGKELPESTVLFAAKLAAKHSKASSSSSVPVDYTPVKYIRKPAGAKAGMVIYKTNKTVYVTPDEEKTK